MHALTQINVELTARCDKACAFCGHQRVDINPAIATAGDMPLVRVGAIANELFHLAARPLVVQFHRDGEPLVYPKLADALGFFDAEGFIRSLVTNGKQLATRAGDLIGRCEAITVSAFNGDPDADAQDLALAAFLDARDAAGATLPRVHVKIVGSAPHDRLDYWQRKLQLPVLWRRIHLPEASRRYRAGDPPRPEHGICLDLLHHPSIAWNGDVFVCNRLDPAHRGRLGNLDEATLGELLARPFRRQLIAAHVRGDRALGPCVDCDYYGLPAG